MYRLWKEAPEQWLLKSKIAWSVRHESRRAPARTAVPSVARPGAPHPSGKPGGGGRNTNTSKRASMGTPGGRPAAPARSVVSLKMLIDAGLMSPGPEALWITYLDQTWHGALDAAGAISFQDQMFYSPSAWAIHCKRLANPGKKADDGWKSVRYGFAEGPMLHDVKLAFLANGGSTGSAAATRSPASDRERRTGLVSGVPGPDAGATLRSSPTAAKDAVAAVAGRATPTKRTREGEDDDARRSTKKAFADAPVDEKETDSPVSAADMAWLAKTFADPAEAEGAAERDTRFAAVAPGTDHASLLGRVVQVFWPSEETWHAGRVLRFDPGSGGASVLYATGDIEQGVVVDALAEKGHLFVL